MAVAVVLVCLYWWWWRSINLKYCYHFTYNNWHLFPLHVCFHLLHIYSPRATIIDTITFHLIYYMTTFQNFFFFLHLMILPLPPRKGPKIWHPKPTRQYLSFDILHDYLSKTMLFFCTWWPCPTPSEGPQNMKSETYSSRPFIWYTTWLPLKNFKFFALMTLSHPLGRAPKYEIRNLLVKSFHLIN
jgi:hypothetical protein